MINLDDVLINSISDQNVSTGQQISHIAKPIRVSRRYVSAKIIERLAIEKYGVNGKGITYTNLVVKGLADNKIHAQETLKHHRERDILFTYGNFKPQKYYATSIRSKVLEAKSSKYPMSVATATSNFPPDNFDKANTLQEVLMALQWFPLKIHKLQLMTNVPCHELELDVIEKCYPYDGYIIENIDGREVKYKVHTNGTVQIYLTCSSDPFKLAIEEDETYLMSALEQVRDRLLLIMKDPHQRFTPQLSEWLLTNYDLNKDIPVTDRMQESGLNIQLVEASRVFRLYIKSMNEIAVCRAEESVTEKNTQLMTALRSLRGSN